jgi:hypothetical protein
MKIVANILIILGLALLALLIVGRLVGNPQVVMGKSIIRLALLDNTIFLLAILAKLLEKK